MNPDINSKFITLLGMPLHQSFAARMQNAAYAAMGLNMQYSYCEVENDHLGDVVNGLRYMPYAGFAVTKPNKVEVLKYLDELDPLCAKMGASNTVVVKDGKLIGYNTDGIGFYRSVCEECPDLKFDETVFFCSGAGGAGRAICSVLAYYGAKKIYITDMFESSAAALVEDINKNFAPVAEQVGFEDKENLYAVAKKSDFLINATGLGMEKTKDQTPYPKEILDKKQICFDATYNPAKTRFLIEAEEVGCKAINGLGMSLYQGAAQIELWSGKDAPIQVMHDELMAILAGK